MYEAALAVVLAAASLVATAHAEERPRTITVSGSGHATGEPDRAHVALAVQKSDPVMATARDEVVGVTRKFIALCQKLGIDAKKVRTSNLNIHPEYTWDPKTNRQLRSGYLVQRDLEVDLDDLQKLGELVEGGVDAGANQVSPPQLDSSRATELSRQALAAATRDAQSNARTIADALGVKLGAAREVTAANSTPAPQPMPMVRAMAMKAGADNGGADTYSTGLIRFDAQITAVFDLVTN
jgi:uncharacterized protein YggE